jgi:hypothetical protein
LSKGSGKGVVLRGFSSLSDRLLSCLSRKILLHLQDFRWKRCPSNITAFTKFVAQKTPEFAGFMLSSFSPLSSTSLVSPCSQCSPRFSMSAHGDPKITVKELEPGTVATHELPIKTHGKGTKAICSRNCRFAYQTIAYSVTVTHEYPKCHFKNASTELTERSPSWIRS